MSLPRITPHGVRKVVRIEENPYQSQHSATLPPLSRRIYDDGTHELFAGDYPVRSVRYYPHYPTRHSYALLDLADDRTFHLEGVTSQENDWLPGEKEDTI